MFNNINIYKYVYMATCWHFGTSLCLKKQMNNHRMTRSWIGWNYEKHKRVTKLSAAYPGRHVCSYIWKKKLVVHKSLTPPSASPLLLVVGMMCDWTSEGMLKQSKITQQCLMKYSNWKKNLFLCPVCFTVSESTVLLSYQHFLQPLFRLTHFAEILNLNYYKIYSHCPETHTLCVMFIWEGTGSVQRQE